MNEVLGSPVETEIDYSVADRWCGVEVALVVELAGGLPAHVRPQRADDRLPAEDGIVDGGRVGDGSDDDVDAVGQCGGTLSGLRA